jgi:gas vesicle protein
MTQNKWSDKLTVFAMGFGVGAILALLFAPASGEETRDYLTGTLKQGIDDAASTGKRGIRRAQETVDDVKDNVAGAVEAGEKAYRTARDA